MVSNKKFSTTYPLYVVFDFIRKYVDKYAVLDSDNLSIDYQIREYSSLPYNKRHTSKVWKTKVVTLQEATRIFKELYPEGSLVK